MVVFGFAGLEKNWLYWKFSTAVEKRLKAILFIHITIPPEEFVISIYIQNLHHTFLKKFLQKYDFHDFTACVKFLTKIWSNIC